VSRAKLAIVLSALLCVPALAAAPENLAPKATITADSVYSNRYPAKGVADGVIPKPMARDDIGRCASSHDKNGGPRIMASWQPLGRRDRLGEIALRIENPHLNTFLLAPLRKAAGGTGRCGNPVFASKDDPDYQAVLKTFLPIHEIMKQTPRMDMPGAQPAACCLAARGER